MILIGRYDSPYVRRVGVSLHALAISFELLPLSPFSQAPQLRQFSPIGRMPALCLADKSYRPDRSRTLPRRRNRDAARCSGSPKPISSSRAAFVRVKGAPGMRKSIAELVDANDRRSGASRWRVVASRAARVHRAHRRRGTERVRIHLPPAASQRRTPPRTGAKPFGIGSRDDGGIG